MSGVPVLDLRDVSVRRGRVRLLGPIDWAVGTGERWTVVGPNGSGKTRLLLVASTFLWPTTGEVSVLGDRVGGTDARDLRRRVGFVSPTLAEGIDGALTPLDVVMTARHAALAPWWHTYTEADRE